MNQLKPFQMIASRFGVSEESAKYFLGQVQKSFKKEKPPHALILEVMDDYEFEMLPDAYDIALLLLENDVWVHALNAPPPLVVDGDEEFPTTSLPDEM